MAVILEPLTLLNHGDSKGVFFNINGACDIESKEGLRSRAFILRPKAVVELRVEVLGAVVLNAD